MVPWIDTTRSGGDPQDLRRLSPKIMTREKISQMPQPLMGKGFHDKDVNF
ncbi:hypothetical protein H6G52_08640 [Limnothrix sp. FACHB-881]|nr:hypothetical protein [Limnothrix sp. FACHB-881]MBD2635423.1 hypothetical protein [Limnothrix sp. FACHB-881]